MGFDWGVAAGDPTASGAVVWTRVDPAMWTVDTEMTLEVATDVDMVNIVETVVVDSADFSSSRDYTYKYDFHGTLEAYTWYWYRFSYEGDVSAVGRFRTLPAATAKPQRVRFGLLTCQHYEEGYYNALGHLATQPGLDAIIHTGDMIYEYTRPDPLSGRDLTLPTGQAQEDKLIPASQADYFYLWRMYRSDAHMQAASAATGWIIVWDDHERWNDAHYSTDYAVMTGPDHPQREMPAAMAQNDTWAITAFRLYTPTRYPSGSPLYRAFVWGDLVELLMLDVRSYRSPHACGGTFAQRVYVAYCADMADPAQTMLGATQLAWLLNRLNSSAARWRVLGNPVMMGDLLLPSDDDPRYVRGTDAWSGFQYERGLILDAATVNAPGFVCLTGDLHAAVVQRLRDTGGDLVGIELMTPAVSSNSLGVELLASLGIGVTEAAHQTIFENNNADLDYIDAYTHGYMVVTLGRNDVGQAELYECDATDSEAAASLTQTWRFDRSGATLLEANC